MGAGGEGRLAPAHVPGTATGTTDRFAQLCRADRAKVKCLLACLPGEARKKRKKGCGGTQRWRDMHRNPVMMHKDCLHHSR